MATIGHVAGDAILAVGSVCLVFSVLAWLANWRRGRTSMRDERGRLRPGAAALASFGLVLVASGAVALIAR